MAESQDTEGYTLVTRKPSFGLPTACPICLPAYCYLKLARFPFQLDFNSTYPDSDHIPYVESGAYVAYNNENGGVIQCLKEDGIVNLDTEFSSIPEWISFGAMVNSYLLDAITYELWLASNGKSTFKIYYSDLPWLIGKALFATQASNAQQRLGITKENAEKREQEIYRRAKLAYGALSARLVEETFLFEDRPSSLDAFVLGHVLFTIHALPEKSVLRGCLLEHDNLVRYTDALKETFLDSDSTSFSIPRIHPESSSSSTPRRGPSYSSKPKSKPKREKTEEEKTFKRRGKYFLVGQAIAILLFLSIIRGYDFSEVDDGDDEGFVYD